jgi:hypothetical protein
MKAKCAGNLPAGLALVAGLAMSAGAQATIIDFSGLADGTMVTNQYPGVVFSLQGGPFSGGAPYINTFYDGTGLPNSALPDYPTANILDIAFSMPVSGVSFTFTNYLSGQGSPAPTSFTAFNASNTVVDSGSLQFVDPGSSFAPISVSGNGITDLQLNNNVGFDNWYFAIQELTFTPSTSATPLPTALPLFATGIGALGLLGWSRKRGRK